MTACGIGTIMMARYILMGRKDPLWEKRDQAAVQKSIYDGCAWLDMHWNPFENPQKRSMNVYHIYYMYCIERAFDLIGNRQRVEVTDNGMADRVCDNPDFLSLTGCESTLFGTNFGVVTDILTAPNGNLWVVSLSHGRIYEIHRS